MITKKNLLKLFADERRMIAYHPEWREFTGSVTATILLQQINYLWDTHGQKPFYKFREPCQHEKYKPGDSWTEELGFSAKEFDAAIKKIGQKVSAIRRAKNPQIDQHHKPVEYWTDEQHLTWYHIHEKNFLAMLSTLYDIPHHQGETPCAPESAYLTKGQLGDVPKVKQEIDQKGISQLTKGQTDLIDERATSNLTKGQIDLLFLQVLIDG